MSRFNAKSDDVMEFKGSLTIPGKGTVSWYAPKFNTPEEREARLCEIGDGLAVTIRNICKRRADEGDKAGARELWLNAFVYPPPPKWLDLDLDENKEEQK